MAETITLYDIPRVVRPGEEPSHISWSPNAWKTRLALGIKGVPFKTEWLNWSEVPTKLQALGLSPNAGSIKYSVPTIYDPKTKRVVTDSYEIAKYLDEQYPDRPTLVAPQTRALQVAFVEKTVGPLLGTFASLITLEEFGQVPEKEKAYFREIWEGRIGKSFEELVLTGEAREAAIKNFVKRLDELARYVAQNGDNAVFVFGDTPSHADTALAALFLWAVRLGGDDYDLVKAIKTASEGRWARYLDAISKYIVDN